MIIDFYKSSEQAPEATSLLPKPSNGTLPFPSSLITTHTMSRTPMHATRFVHSAGLEDSQPIEHEVGSMTNRERITRITKKLLPMGDCDTGNLNFHLDYRIPIESRFTCS